MRILFALFFLFTLPLIIFLSVIIYAGTTSVEIKQEFAKSNIYEKLIAGFQNPLTQSDVQSSDPEFAMLFSFLQEALTPEYLQRISEKLIDDTTDWMNDKTQNPPIISFKEVKQKLLAKNPQLLTQAQEAIEELKNAAQESPELGSAEQLDSLNTQTQKLNSLIASDLTIPLEKNLTPLKNGYKWLKIIVPILILFTLLSLFLIVSFTHGRSAKFRWLAILLAASALYGFFLIGANSTILASLEKLLLGYDNKLVTLLTPILTNLLSVFAKQYKSYQTLVSQILLALSAIFLVLSFVFKSPSPDRDTKAVRKSLKKAGI